MLIQIKIMDNIIDNHKIVIKWKSKLRKHSVKHHLKVD